MRNSLRHHRKKMGLSQAQLGHVVNYCAFSIEAIESGRYMPDALLLLQFSKFFNVPPEQICIPSEEELKLNKVPEERVEDVSFLGIKLPWKKTVLVEAAI